MSFSGLDYNAGSQGSFNNTLIAQRTQAEIAVKGGAQWFLWIAGLSMVNSILSVSGAGFRFIFGLGLASLVDGLARGLTQAGTAGTVLNLFINACVAGIFVLFWNFARQGHKWAFLVGMVFYALDGVLVLLFKDYLALVFHGYVIYRIYNSLGAVSQLEQLRQMTPQAAAPAELR
jgi:hypothetical protein